MYQTCTYVYFTGVIYYISEINLYGSARLGMIKDYLDIGGRTYSTSGTGGGTPPAMTYYSWDGVPKETRGEKFFELSNHLGNVLSVVSDRKLPVDDGLSYCVLLAGCGELFGLLSVWDSDARAGVSSGVQRYGKRR
ncbi:hypothetical protein GCM10009118_07430 [Wandonia haliotis]|uniref:Uncharacterized protein n=1 Tax=Wandonia haliotis TaxID=574963 RepID=A0ABN1MM69_9FLAO